MTATLSCGVRLWYSTDNKVTFTEIVDLERINEPAVKESPDVAINTLTSCSAQQFMPGVPNGGTLEFTQYWTKDRYNALQSQYGKVIDWKISYPDATVEANKSKVEFQGYLNRLGISSHDSPDTPITITARVKVTGQVIFTPGT